MPDIAGIHHINLTVRDLARSVAWYSRLFGAPKAFDDVDEQQGWAKAGLRHPGSGLFINFTQHRGSAGEAFDERRTGLDHVAFRVADRAELEAWRARLEELGVEHSPIKEAGYGDVLTFRDPDNIQLEIYAPWE
jgi:catechol 2,3-dioxygenase-like lactoylglutathione lyase family enzyme